MTLLMTRAAGKAALRRLAWLALWPLLVQADPDAGAGMVNARSAFLTVVKPFEISYQARMFGMNLKGTASLESQPGGLYEYRFNAGSVLGRINEVSTFVLDDESGVVPTTYSYKRSGLGKNKQARVIFDWLAGRVRDQAAKAPWSLDVPAGTLDTLSMQIQLRADALRGERAMVYPIAKDGSLRTYRFNVEGEEVTGTPLGPLRTLRVRRDRGPGDPQETRFWLAMDWNYVIVKIRDGNPADREYEVVVTKAMVDGQPVTPLPAEPAI